MFRKKLFRSFFEGPDGKNGRSRLTAENSLVLGLVGWERRFFDPELVVPDKSKTLLEGPRGLPKANKEALVKTLVHLSHLPQKHANITELDINPLIVNKTGVFAVDVRISFI